MTIGLTVKYCAINAARFLLHPRKCYGKHFPASPHSARRAQDLKAGFSSELWHRKQIHVYARPAEKHVLVSPSFPSLHTPTNRTTTPFPTDIPSYLFHFHHLTDWPTESLECFIMTTNNRQCFSLDNKRAYMVENCICIYTAQNLQQNVCHISLHTLLGPMLLPCEIQQGVSTSDTSGTLHANKLSMVTTIYSLFWPCNRR